MIRLATQQDIGAITAIYNEAIAAGNATGDIAPTSVESRQLWLAEHNPAKYPVYVYEREGQVQGWCSISAYRRGREALRYTAEISYFVSRAQQRRGIGSALLEHAIGACESLRLKTLFAIVLECNSASCAFHEKHGFQRWGFLPRVADFDGREYGHIYYGRRLAWPNQSLQPTSFSVTHPAGAGCAPEKAVAEH